MTPSSSARQVEITFPDGTKKNLTIPTIQDWGKVVEILKPQLHPGSILALSGPLGAGKTTLVQAIVQALGSTKPAQSPTFALMRSYPVKNWQGIKRLIHVDAYRLENEKEFVVLDLDEELGDGESALMLEWPEKVPGWLNTKSHIFLKIDL